MGVVEDLFDDLLNLINVKGMGSPTMILSKLRQIQTNLVSELDDVNTALGLRLIYKGTHDASLGVYPTPTDLSQGWYYIITTGGNIGGIDYLTGDWIVYNGTIWNKLAYDTYTSGDFGVDFGTKDTDDLSEGVNKYWAQGLFNTAFGLKDTDDLSEGVNKYWAQGLFNTAFGLKDTDDLSEGVNKYITQAQKDALHATYTDAEVEAIIIAELVNGQSIDNAIDNLILTHKNIATAHHNATVAGDLNHNDLANLNAGDNYEHITQAQKDALHATYTDAEVEAIIIAELVNGQSIDNAIDALIGAAIKDDVYGVGWDTDTTHPASRNALYDKIELIVQSITDKISDSVYSVDWNTITDVGASKNAIYDKIESLASGAEVGITSTSIVHANDDLRTSYSLVFEIVKVIKMYQNLKSCRVYFELAAASAGWVYGEIRVNGVQVAQEEENSSTMGKTFWFQVNNLKYGDSIEIWGKTSNVEIGCKVSYMKICYDIFVDDDPE